MEMELEIRREEKIENGEVVMGNEESDPESPFCADVFCFWVTLRLNRRHQSLRIRRKKSSSE